MEDYCASDDRPLARCLHDVEKCDLFIGLYGRRYGFVPHEQNSNPNQESITVLEFRRAVFLGKPRLLFVLDESAARYSPEESDDNESRQAAFLKEVMLDRVVANFTTPESIGTSIAIAYHRWTTRLSATSYAETLVAQYSHLPRSPINDGRFPIDDILDPVLAEIPAPSPLGGTMPKDNIPDAVPKTGARLIDIVASAPRILLSGPSGCGKSIALRHVAYRLAKNYLDTAKGATTTDEELASAKLPVLINLRGFRGGLITRITEVLLTRGFFADSNLVRARLQSDSFQFLLDGLDEASVKELIYNELDDLEAAAPKSNWVLTTCTPSNLSDLKAAHFKVQPLTIVDVSCLLERILGAQQANDLAERLRLTGIIDSFNTPLSVWMASRAYTELHATGTSLSIGEIYKAVAERPLITDESVAYVPHRIKLRVLGSLAFRLRWTNSSELPEHEFAKLCRKVPELKDLGLEVMSRLIDAALTKGILYRSATGISFWHRTFEDYFCAVWLSEEAPDWRFDLCALSPRWHSALLLACCMLPSKRAERFVRGLLLGLPSFVSGGTLGELFAERLFLFLRCVLYTGHDLRALVSGLLRRLRQRKLFPPLCAGDAYLDETDIDAAAYTRFSILLSKTAVPGVSEWLTHSSLPWRAKLAGLFFLHDSRHFSELIEHLSACPLPTPGILSEDMLGFWYAGWLLAAHSSSEERSLLFRHILEMPAEAAVRLLRCMSHGVSMQRQKASLPRLAREWREYLLLIAIDSDDLALSSAAVSALRSLGIFDESLPVFEAVARDGGEPHQKINALRALAYSVRWREALSVAREVAIHDVHLSVINIALWVLMIHDEKMLFPALARLIRRLLRYGMLRRPDTSYVRSIKNGMEAKTHARSRVLALFIEGLQAEEFLAIRAYSCRAVADLGRIEAVPVLKDRWAVESVDLVRAELLHALVALLGDAAEPYLSAALSARGTEVCSRACSCLCNEKCSKAIVRHLGKELYSIAVGQDIRGGRDQAARALKQIGYLSDAFVPGLRAHSNYLGPSTDEG